ncbi:hypothetical protein Ate01nite_58940 [Actinoplanes teichomyceticus]|nr:hypothetical protein Ate01nite_58940 [Actinoplanes teichomyceticus]
MLVTVRRDWAAGRVGPDRDAVTAATIATDTRTMTVRDLTVDLGGSTWRGFLAMVRLGGQHILAGTDHLLFPLVLLLPVTLRARAGRWRGPSRPPSGGRDLRLHGRARVSLAVCVLGRARFPAAPVEVFIAASILVGALHAIRPLFPTGRPPWPACSASATGWRSRSRSPVCS